MKNPIRLLKTKKRSQESEAFAYEQKKTRTLAYALWEKKNWGNLGCRLSCPKKQSQTRWSKWIRETNLQNTCSLLFLCSCGSCSQHLKLPCVRVVCMRGSSDMWAAGARARRGEWRMATSHFAALYLLDFSRVIPVKSFRGEPRSLALYLPDAQAHSTSHVAISSRLIYLPISPSPFWFISCCSALILLYWGAR